MLTNKISESPPNSTETNRAYPNTFYHRNFTPYAEVKLNQNLEKTNLERILSDNVTKANYQTLSIMRLSDNSNKKKVKSGRGNFNLLKEGIKKNIIDTQKSNFDRKVKKKRNSISIYYDIKKQISNSLKKKNIFSYHEFLKFKQEQEGKDYSELQKQAELKRLKEKERKDSAEKKEKEKNILLCGKNTLRGSLIHSASMIDTKEFFYKHVTMNTISRLNTHSNYRKKFTGMLSLNKFSNIENGKKISSHKQNENKIAGEFTKNNIDIKIPITMGIKMNQNEDDLRNSYANFTKKNSKSDPINRNELFHSIDEGKINSANEKMEETKNLGKFGNFGNKLTKKVFLTSNKDKKLVIDTKDSLQIDENSSNLLSTRSQFGNTQKSFLKYFIIPEKSKTQSNNNTWDEKNSGPKITNQSNKDIKEDLNDNDLPSYSINQNLFHKSSTNFSNPNSTQNKNSKKIIIKKCNEFIEDNKKFVDYVENQEIDENVKSHLENLKNILKTKEKTNLKISKKPNEFSGIRNSSNGFLSYIDNRKAKLIKFTDSCVTMSENMMDKIGLNSIEKKYNNYAIDANLVFGYHSKVRTNFETPEMKLEKIRRGLYKMKIKNSKV